MADLAGTWHLSYLESWAKDSEAASGSLGSAMNVFPGRGKRGQQAFVVPVQPGASLADQADMERMDWPARGSQLVDGRAGRARREVHCRREDPPSGRDPKT